MYMESLIHLINLYLQADDFSTLAGDFFVYSDIFSEGFPAYWSGYFSTRPFMKQLSRELEANLRAAEILFTVGYQTAKVCLQDLIIPTNKDRKRPIYLCII